METRIKIMGTSIGIDKWRNEYRAIYTHPGGRIFKRLGIKPSHGVTRFADENPKVIMQVVSASSVIANQLSDEGAFSARGRYLFGDVMEEFLVWHETYRNNTKLRSHAKPALERFGNMRLNKISRADVRKWIDELALHYRDNTIRNRVNPAKQMFNWLIREARYDGHNPFENHEWKAKNQTEYEVKPTITNEEWSLIRNLCDDPYLEQAMALAYHTGLRPSEIYRIRPDDIDHEQMTLTVRVRKTGTHIRLISIPAALSSWALNHKWRDLKESTVQHRIIGLKGKHPALSTLCMGSFRKNFAAVMEMAGADHETIDAHQGRFQSSVIKKHYLRDKYRAVRLMRPYINKVFDGGKVDILRVAD